LSLPPPSSFPPPAAKKIQVAIVTYSYVAENPDELDLQPGQLVEILAEEEEGWWRGRINGREGIFPSNFVESIEQSGSTASSDPNSMRQNINACFCSIPKLRVISSDSW